MTFASGKVDFIYAYVHRPGPARPVFFFFVLLVVVWADAAILYSLVIGEKWDVCWWGRADYGLGGWLALLGLTLDSLSLSLSRLLFLCVCVSVVCVLSAQGLWSWEQTKGEDKLKTQNSKGGATKKSRAGNLLIEANESKQESLNSLKKIGNCCCCSALQFRFFSLAWEYRWIDGKE